MQDALTVTVAIFLWMGLETNLDKTNTMVCNPGLIWGKLGELSYKRRESGQPSGSGRRRGRADPRVV